MTRALITKLFSAVARRFVNAWQSLQSYLIAAITEKSWLLDWVPQSRADAQSVMLVRLDVIGDFVLWLDSARAFRSLYPGRKLVLYANSTWAELATQLTHWDEVIAIDMVRLRGDELYRLQTFYRIHRRGFAIAIQATYSREYMGDMLTRASGATQRIGFAGDLSNILPEKKSTSDRWYTNLIQTDSAQIMELKRNAEFIRALGLSTFISDVPQIEPLLNLPEELKNSTPYAVIFPGASWEPKMWPPGKFSALINALCNRYGLTAVLCGGPAEQTLCDEVIELTGLGSAKNFAGRTKLTELVEVIRHARFVVANDTSAIHIAVATQTPSVCVLGGGHYGRFLPYAIETTVTRELPKISVHKMTCFHCNWNCIHTTHSQQTVPCIDNIAVEEVLVQCAAALRG